MHADRPDPGAPALVYAGIIGLVVAGALALRAAERRARAAESDLRSRDPVYASHPLSARSSCLLELSMRSRAEQRAKQASPAYSRGGAQNHTRSVL